MYLFMYLFVYPLSCIMLILGYHCRRDFMFLLLSNTSVSWPPAYTHTYTHTHIHTYTHTEFDEFLLMFRNQLLELKVGHVPRRALGRETDLVIINHAALLVINNHAALLVINNHAALLVINNHAALLVINNYTALLVINNHAALLVMNNHSDLLVINNHAT